MTTQQNPTLEGWEKQFGRQWYKFFEKETQSWYNALLDHEPCMVCGIDPKLILGVSKLIPAEITAAKVEAERKAYERVIKEVPDEVDKECSYSEYGHNTETFYLSSIKEQLRTKLLNQLN